MNTCLFGMLLTAPESGCIEGNSKELPKTHWHNNPVPHPWGLCSGVEAQVRCLPGPYRPPADSVSLKFQLCDDFWFSPPRLLFHLLPRVPISFPPTPLLIQD